jgi:hypothetical protein
MRLTMVKSVACSRRQGWFTHQAGPEATGPATHRDVMNSRERILRNDEIKKADALKATGLATGNVINSNATVES